MLAFLDDALTDPALDAGRVGVMGGSYGGYLTTFLIGRTSRFVAAISERAFLDPISFVGSSDIGWNFPDQYLGTDPTRLAAQSALTNAAAITTPTLVIHSEEDWRCPLEQGARLFVELKRRGVPTELLLFPGEGHELSRSGRPRHRLARLEHVLRWWARWLPTPAEPGRVRHCRAGGRVDRRAGEPLPVRGELTRPTVPPGRVIAVVERRLPRWSELRELVRPRRLPGDATDRRLARAATIGDLREIARRRVPRAVFDYTDGAAGAEISLRRSREAFERVEFRPERAARRVRRRPVDDAPGRRRVTAAGLRADRVHPPDAHRGRGAVGTGRRAGRRPLRAVDDGHDVDGGAGRPPPRAPGGGSSCTCGATGRPAPPSSSGRGPPATRRWC